MPPPPQSSSRDSGRTRGSSQPPRRGGARGGPKKVVHAPPPMPEQLEGGLHGLEHVQQLYSKGGTVQLKPKHLEVPKSVVQDYAKLVYGRGIDASYQAGYIGRTPHFRCTVILDETLGIVGVGDAPTKKDALKIACISIEYQLQALNLLENPIKLVIPKPKETDATTTLSNGEEISFERARQFMDYYCRRFDFGKPDISYEAGRGGSPFYATLTVGGRRIGIGTAPSKKAALVQSYLDVAQYLEKCDPELWKAFVEAAKTGKDAGLAPKVLLQMSEVLGGEIRDLCDDVKESGLYLNYPKEDDPASVSATALEAAQRGPYVPPSAEFFENKSQRLKARLDEYRRAPEHAKMRASRESLPVYTKIKELLDVVDANDVTICMAATGSGKTTQVPQLILDQWIDRGEGARCNVICTQPRRIAAISVAQRVANERGEALGRGSIGYQVRFDSKVPLDHGSVTFCTTGIFLNRMQKALEMAKHDGPRQFDEVTHVIVDEVHERDVDIDLTLMVIKRMLADRKARGIPIKVILMSATIDPTLFQQYFAAADGTLAPVSEIPGRAYPVQKKLLEEVLQEFGGPQAIGPSSWVFSEKSVANYIGQEAGPQALAALGFPGAMALVKPLREDSSGEDLDIPVPLVALSIAHVLKKSEDGHVLVFLPGWDTIQSLQKTLIHSGMPLLGLNFSDSSKYSIHLLHSTVPIAEQQAIFEPAAPGIRRIILATNIAETSVTIPDVVYVVDTGKVKEQRYDPERHISSLVSAWVGSSNLNQRAGRAGRHRPGEYYGLVSSARMAKLNPYQTVEIKRVDLSNVVMHIKALNFPGLEVEEVLAQTIEPPTPERVGAAIENLKMVGALDERKCLTSLGRVLLQIPIDVQLGRLLMYGSFFRCLDPALTLAAIMSNRDAFNNPPLLKKEAKAAREFWSPQNFRSDVLATLRAYYAWWDLQGSGQFAAANTFCNEQFLSKPVLLQIQNLKGHLLHSLARAGVLSVSGGGVEVDGRFPREVPPELNANADSLPMLAALVAIGSQPNFAIRVTEKLLRTAQERNVLVFPGSVNNRTKESKADSGGGFVDKQLFAFAEKVRNVSSGSANSGTFIRGCTQLDPMTYLLFGAYNAVVTERGLECDGWLPIVGRVDILDDIQTLKTRMDKCFLRVFEGIAHHRQQFQQRRLPNRELRSRNTQEDDDDVEDLDESDAIVEAPKSRALNPEEVKEFDYLTRDVVRILERYSEERLSQSRMASRPGTPSAYGSPNFQGRLQLPRSGYSSPYPRSGYNSPFTGSRPTTPSSLRTTSYRAFA